jgi:predicted Zn-dependent protease
MLLCGCAKNPYQIRKEFQEQQAERLRPAALEREDGGWRAMRTLRVRLYTDEPAAKHESARSEFEERLARANKVLESALRLRLMLEEVRALPPQPQAKSQDTEALLLEMEQLDAAQDVDFVVAITSSAPVVTLSFHELGRARVLGKHIVLRTMDDVGELRALEGFDTLEPTERSRLYQQRKRHKEAAVLLHELGHCLGALHTRDAAELMHPAYDHAMQSFAPANLELMGYVIEDRVAGNDPPRSPALITRLSDALKQSPFDGWVDEERRSFLAQLETAVASGAPPEQTAAANEQPPAQPATPSEDLSALSEADRGRYLGLDDALRQQAPKAVYDTLVELARAYPDSFPVQQKACQIGMRIGLTHHALRPFCDRMMQLSMQQSSP